MKKIDVLQEAINACKEVIEMKGKRNVEEVALMVLRAGAVEIREVPQRLANEAVESLPRENQPFLYASGNWGPGYVSIKGLVGQGEIIPLLVKQLAAQITEKELSVDFVAGNITGGVIPGWQLSQELEVPFVYVGGTRKKGEAEAPITMLNKTFLEEMSTKLCEAVIQSGADFNFVAGLVPSGMILGYRLSQLLSERLDCVVPFVYIREARKKGGQKEVITGIANNPYIAAGDSGIVISQVTDFSQTVENGVEALQEEGFKAIDGARLLKDFEPNALEDIGKVEMDSDHVVSLIPPTSKGIVIEELVNFAQSTCNSADVLREAGYKIDHAGTILFYENPEAIKALAEHGIEMFRVFTLPDLIAVAERNQTHSQKTIDDYRTFLTNPLEWQAARGLTRVERGGTTG